MGSPSMITYVIGAVLVAAVVAGAWYFRSSANQQTASMAPPAAEPVVPAATPTPGPITGLVCDKQYYNQKIGFPQYYLSVEGGDFSSVKNVSCEFTARTKEKVLATATGESPLTEAPQRNGATFRCTSKAVEITPNIPTMVDVTLKDDLGKTSTCTATFTFPAP